MARRLALTKDGKITWCTAAEENLGKGRCNHVLHQAQGQSPEDFIDSCDMFIAIDNGTMQDVNTPTIEMLSQKELILSTISENGLMTKDPDWCESVSTLPNPFTIGSRKDGTYEEAELVDFSQTLVERPDGNTQHLIAKYKFRGQVYECDFGEVPAVNQDGTVTINNVDWRILPVLDQHKAGIVSYADTIVARQNDSYNVAFSMTKSTGECKVLGRPVALEDIQAFYDMSDEEREHYNGKLSLAQVLALSNIDPVVFQRFPEGFNLQELRSLPADQCSDLSWRKALGYQDIVRDQMRLQMRRMGVTFRTNLARRQEYMKEHPDATENELNEKFPLFYQANLTQNIKKELVGRSNVQFAENLNPIAALSQSKKVSLTGPGGFNKDKAPYALRMPHNSHEGIVDSMDTSSGKNVGLTMTLSHGTIGKDGFIHHETEKTITPSDFIPYLHHDDPSRSTMAVAHLKQSCPIVGGEEPLIKTEAWDKIKGAKLGCNLSVAYIPNAGTFEDAVIISQSAADKMKTVKAQHYNCDVSKAGVKVGDKVSRKQIIGGQAIKVGGIVKNIDSTGVTIETVYDMTPGDKLSNRHGGKSIVSEVRPDSEMPHIMNDDGTETTVDVIMSPMSIIGRKNLGAVMEMNDAYHSQRGTKSHDNINESHKIRNGKTLVEASAGTQFIMRLNHIAEEKLSSYADELDSKGEPVGNRLGEQESILLSTNRERLQILSYLRHQEARDSHNKLSSLLKSIGVDMKIDAIDG